MPRSCDAVHVAPFLLLSVAVKYFILVPKFVAGDTLLIQAVPKYIVDTRREVLLTQFLECEVVRHCRTRRIRADGALVGAGSDRETKAGGQKQRPSNHRYSRKGER